MKGLFASIVFLVLLVIATAVLVVARPQLIVNDHFLGVGARIAVRFGVHVSWDRGHIAIESPGFLEKRVHLEFNALCVKIPEIGLDACFDQAKLAAAGGLKGWKPRVSEIGPVDLRGGRVSYIASVESANSTPPRDERDPKSKSAAKNKGELIPRFLEHARLMPLHIDAADLKYVDGNDSVTGALNLNSRVGAQGAAQISLQADVNALPGKQKASARLELENPHGFLELDGWELAGHVKGALPDGTAIDADVKLDPRAGGQALSYDYAVDGSYAKARLRVDVKARGDLSPDRFSTRLTGLARGLVPQLDKLWVNDCDIVLERQGVETRPGALKVNCPLQALIPVPPKGFPPIAMPARAGARVTADLKSSAFPPGADSEVDGKVGVVFDPVLTPILQGGGHVESVVSGVPRIFPRGWKMDTDLGVHLKIAHFERLVRQLANTPYDIWAPARVLKGEVALNVEGRFDANQGSAPVQLKTRLASERQRLNVDAAGSLNLVHLFPSPRFHLAMDVGLTEVQLELPPLPGLPTPSKLKPDALPQFFPDGRFTAAGANIPKSAQLAGRAEPVFTYDIRIHTPDEQHPVKFLTPQIKTPLPLAMNVNLVSDVPLNGQIKVLSFPLELFKRNVQLDHMTVSLAPIAKDSSLNGRIVIPYTDYTITILLLGTTEKPQLKFLSDPPLPDDQIIAVLIFGQSMDALDPDQQRSVGNSKAALLSGALGLASLYYLSSMNIESVDYDPQSHTASMRYRLGEGTSLNVSQGLNGGETTVGIRKRLTKHLAITTTLNNPSDQQTRRTVSSFLEWAYQY